MSDEVAALYTEEQIARRVAELGQEIGRAYASQQLSVLGLTEESLVFVADLVRRIPLDLTMHLLRVSQKGAGIVYDTAATPLAGRHVLLVDDVVDTGVTLSYVVEHMREQCPGSLRVCALIDKPHVRKVDVGPDWSAFTLGESADDRFLVGYGMGWKDRFRNLPYIGAIPRPRPA